MSFKLRTSRMGAACNMSPVSDLGSDSGKAAKRLSAQLLKPSGNGDQKLVNGHLIPGLKLIDATMKLRGVERQVRAW